MAQTQSASTRPWTPTEDPNDASYRSVVYHGDQHSPTGDSEESSEDESGLIQVISPSGKEVAPGTQGQQPPPLRFRASQAFLSNDSPKDDGRTTYQAYQKSPTLPAPSHEIAHTLRPQRSSQALSSSADERSPAGNPYRLSKILGTPSDPALLKQSADTAKGDKAQEVPINNPYRQSSASSSESTEDLIIQPKRPPPESRRDSTASAPLAAFEALSQPRRDTTESAASVRSPRISQAPVIKADDDLPSVVGKSSREITILLINPNSTKSMTEACLESLEDTLPRSVTVYGFTPSRPAPTAIESHTDAVMSTAACVKAIIPIAAKYDALLIACFSHHPLIAALREQLMQPVIGIMEASLYASRMCGSKFGIVTTDLRSMHMLESSVRNTYKLDDFSVGVESTRMGVLDLESRPIEEIEQRLGLAARRLQARGADCVCLGCAGMTEMRKAVEGAVGMHDRMAMVIDGVAIGVHFLVGLVRENLGTAKGAGYNLNSGHKALRPAG